MQKHVGNSLGLGTDGVSAGEVVDQMIVLGMRSSACMCIVPLQDMLHLGSGSRMNVPGTTDGNWIWSFDWETVNQSLADKYMHFVKNTDRLLSNDV